MKKKLLTCLAVGLLIGGATGVALALPFTDTVDFSGDQGPHATHTFIQITNYYQYSHTLPGFSSPAYTLDSASLTLMHNGNSNNAGEVWFSSGENGASDYRIGRLSTSSGTTWTTDTWTLGPDILNLISSSNPWTFTINLFDVTSGADKIKIDYSTLAGEYSVPPPPAVPEPATLLLLGSGLAGLAAAQRRRVKK